ncbi:unnamed protein product [Albugo candida]|uniref:Uncharacterized protein n=1 Tax=Albugo candida TaxID=65357 RepID=A0A024FYA1_9STRA|nr:unnamed protein product [Albugo candida]|eukprot:CCI11649.1 unnamed protein product [Albugo candida]
MEVWDNKYVHVTQDESTFYSSDGREEFRVEEGDSWIRKKGPGGSIMIGDFLCPCHGPMKVTDQQVRENGLTSPSDRDIIKACKNSDGWWKSEDMDALLELKIDSFFPGTFSFRLIFQPSGVCSQRAGGWQDDPQAQEREDIPVQDGWCVKLITRKSGDQCGLPAMERFTLRASRW